MWLKNNMTKYNNFIEALKQLCIEHDVQLDTGYDGCAVYDMETEGYSAGMAFSQDIVPYDATILDDE